MNELLLALRQYQIVLLGVGLLLGLRSQRATFRALGRLALTGALAPFGLDLLHAVGHGLGVRASVWPVPVREIAAAAAGPALVVGFVLALLLGTGAGRALALNVAASVLYDALRSKGCFLFVLLIALLWVLVW